MGTTITPTQTTTPRREDPPPPASEASTSSSEGGGASGGTISTGNTSSGTGGSQSTTGTQSGTSGAASTQGGATSTVSSTAATTTTTDSFTAAGDTKMPQHQYAAQGENVFGVDSDGAELSPSGLSVSDYIAQSREGVATSTARPEVKATVSDQLATVQARHEAGDLSSEDAIEHTKIWNDHLGESERSVQQEKLARAEEIENMGPLRRVGAFAHGLGTGALKTGKGAYDAAKTVLELTPGGAIADIANDTMKGTLKTGDLNGSFKQAVSDQWSDTKDAAQSVLDTGKAVGQLATDATEVAFAPVDIVAEGAVSAVMTGDVKGSFQAATEKNWNEAVEGGQRLLHVAGEATGVNNILSGDPNKIGQGTFDLALTLAPMAKNPNAAKGVVAAKTSSAAKLPKATKLPGANTIKPFNRPPGSGVALKPKPVTGAPSGVAVIDDAKSITQAAPLARKAPGSMPTLKGPGSGGRRPWGPISNSARGIGAASEGGSFENFEKRTNTWRINNNTSKKPDRLHHDRLHTFFEAPTSRQGEAIVNSAEQSLKPAAIKTDLGDDFFKADRLQSQFDEFRSGVHNQLDQAKENIRGQLKDRTLTEDGVKDIFKTEGIRFGDDAYQTQINDAIEHVFDRYGNQPGKRHHRLQRLVDTHLRPPSDQELLGSFKEGVINMKATRDANAGLLEDLAKNLGDDANGTSVLLNDNTIDAQLIVPDAAQLNQVRSQFGPQLDRIQAGSR